MRLMVVVLKLAVQKLIVNINQKEQKINEILLDEKN